MGERPIEPQASDASQTEELRTPDCWAAAEGVRILNADGWRDPDPKPFDESITYAEYPRRVTHSSCEMPAWPRS